MNVDALKSWTGQSTTGQGFTLLAALIAGLTSHQITLDQAIIGVVPAIILVIWPEKVAVAAAAAPLAGDLEKAIQAYSLGVRHGTAGAAAAVAPTIAPALQDAAKLFLAAASTPPVSPPPAPTPSSTPVNTP
jgi:hypothetical protein